MRLFKILLIALVAVAFFSCSKPSYNKEYSWAYPVAGDWTVKADDGTKVSAPFEIKSYNSSMGKDSVWFDDYPVFNTSLKVWEGHLWGMKFKAAVNMTNKTFATTGSINALKDYGIKVKVTDGKIIGKDSISMNVVFEDDPTTIYKVAGHRTVSYEEYTQQ